VTLRDRERAVLELARDDLLRLDLLRLRDAAGLRDLDLDLDLDAGDLALRREPEDRDLLRLAFLVAPVRLFFL